VKLTQFFLFADLRNGFTHRVGHVSETDQEGLNDVVVQSSKAAFQPSFTAELIGESHGLFANRGGNNFLNSVMELLQVNRAGSDEVVPDNLEKFTADLREQRLVPDFVSQEFTHPFRLQDPSGETPPLWPDSKTRA